MVEPNKMIDFTQKVENYLDDFEDKEGCSFISEDVDRIKWAVTTIAEKVFGYDKLGNPTEPKSCEKICDTCQFGSNWTIREGKPCTTCRNEKTCGLKGVEDLKNCGMWQPKPAQRIEPIPLKSEYYTKGSDMYWVALIAERVNELVNKLSSKSE